MISQRISRVLATMLIAVSAVGMLAVSFDAEARRMGGGKSFGRQSSNVTQQRQAVTPPAAANTAQRSAAPAAGAAAAGTAAKSGMSRFLGPLAGIAAGLGIAALLSSLGLGGAMLEFLSSAVLIGIVVFGVMFLIRRLRGAGSRTATQGAGNVNNQYRQSNNPGMQPQYPRAAQQPAPAPVSAAPAAAAYAAPEQTEVDSSWFIPADFDITSFLANSKQRFVEIQALWDKGDVNALREYLTDDLLIEATPQIQQRESDDSSTEVVLLNAELLGIEKVAGGHLASIRYSGMLREGQGTEAFRFEEVWNLYKEDNAGWLVAGIQQLTAND
ncbi:Tim44 domain-containing protein [Paenalcaligenes sp. Me131]|uniref:Tim44 domain-containing protein n=1 Tax=Paenalcaligenes sp. Me131 TaxID=3392636 RepID=UPI003D2D5116